MNVKDSAINFYHQNACRSYIPVLLENSNRNISATLRYCAQFLYSPSPLYIIKRHVQQVYSVFVPTVAFVFVWCDIFNKELRVESQTSLFCLMDLHSCTCYCYFTLLYFISRVNMILLKYGLCIK